ncbi:hypothetical protein [Neptuniibacter sp.]|uniref:hypothetical protein n=1 Tax=Neptuniibacter sp. TaxID=1962643 RepID=UPI003B5B3652
MDNTEKESITLVMQLDEVSPPPQIVSDRTVIYKCNVINKVPTSYLEVLSKILQYSVDVGILEEVCNFDHTLEFDFKAISDNDQRLSIGGTVLSAGITADVDLSDEQLDKAIEILCYCIDLSFIQRDHDIPPYHGTLSTEEEELVKKKFNYFLTKVKSSEKKLNNPIRFANSQDEFFVLSGELPVHTPKYKKFMNYKAEITIDGCRRRRAVMFATELRGELKSGTPVPTGNTELHLDHISVLDGMGTKWREDQWHEVTIDVLRDKVTGKIKFSITAMKPSVEYTQVVLPEPDDFMLEPYTES